MHRKLQSECVAVANPGIIFVGIPRTASKRHFEFCMTLCVWQHERGALYIMILTDSEDVFLEEQFCALETIHRSEGSAWLGRDLRQAGTGAKLESNIFAMNRACVWTNSSTMAEHIQQEAIAREGPLHSEELFPFAENSDARTSPQPCHAVLRKDCATQLTKSS